MSYKMRSFSLLILSLMAACEVWSEAKECRKDKFNSHEINCTSEIATRRLRKDSERPLNVNSEHGAMVPECKSQSTSSEFDIAKFRRSPKAGQNFTYWCDYSKVKDAAALKFICKGEDPSTCQHLVNTTKPDVNKRFSMKDEETKKNITITMREVTTSDSGTYWCGVETTDNQCSNTFINKLTMTVVTPTRSSPPVPTTQETTLSTESHVQATTAPAESRGVFNLVIAVIVCGVVLLLVIVWILIYKRSSHSRNPSNAAAKQRCKEDYVYEEISERLQNTMNTVYVTASLPTNDTASLHYSTIHFRNSSDKTEAPIPKPGSPACQYSTLKYSNTPTYSTVNQPSREAQDPLYSTINKTPQQ